MNVGLLSPILHAQNFLLLVICKVASSGHISRSVSTICTVQSNMSQTVTFKALQFILFSCLASGSSPGATFLPYTPCLVSWSYHGVVFSSCILDTSAVSNGVPANAVPNNLTFWSQVSCPVTIVFPGHWLSSKIIIISHFSCLFRCLRFPFTHPQLGLSFRAFYQLFHNHEIG